MIKVNDKTKNANFELFKKVYFSDSKDFKTQLLPIWTEKFSLLISLEQKHKIQHYYKRFSQGTIVMVDFGVRIGGEISGKHFGAVLNRNDSKYEPNILVIPLTSKEKKRYVPLDYEVMEECSRLLSERSDSCLNKIKVLEGEKEEFIKKFNISHHNFTFKSDVDASILRESGVENASNLVINLGPDINSNDNMLNLLEKIKKHRDFDKSINVKKFVLVTDEILTKTHEFNCRISKLVEEIGEFKKLEKRMEKYTKSTFADVKNIATVSKMRTEKISDYTISGNISLSENSINKLKDKLSSII